LLESQEQIERHEKGIEAETPFVINDDENAQRIKAEKIFIPYHSLDNIQYGEFNQETV